MSTRRIVTVLVVTSLAGCASVPIPVELAGAIQRLERVETSALEAGRPELIREARTWADRANKAHDDGDAEQAELMGRVSSHRYDSAVHLAARESARASVAVLGEQQATLEREEAGLHKQLIEIERMRGLESQIASLQAELAQVDAASRSEAARAKRALVEARNKQAQAIAAGAAVGADRAYQEGRALVEATIESLRLELFAEALATAQRASSVFDAAIAGVATAAENATAREAEQQSAALGKAARRKKARAALDRAAEAEKQAIESGVTVGHPAKYAVALRSMRAAENSYVEGDYEDAVRRAGEAESALARPPDAPIARDTGLEAVEAAQDVRVSALARDASHPRLPEADYHLELARTAVADGRAERARTKAEAATGIYRAIAAEGEEAEARLDPARPGGVRGISPVPRARGPAKLSDLQGVAGAKLLDLRLARADALGSRADLRCPGTFRAVDALIDLADQLIGTDPARSFEVAVRASERLRACELRLPEQDSAAVTVADTRGPDPAEPAARAAADSANREMSKAQDALQRAQIHHARASAEIEPKQLARATKLLEQAEKWFERGSHRQVIALSAAADDAVKSAARAQATADKAAQRVAASKQAAGDKKEADAAEKRRAVSAQTLRQAQETLARAMARVTDDPRLREPRALVLSAERWFERGASEEASALAKRAVASVERILATPAPAPRAVETATVSRRVEAPSAAKREGNSRPEAPSAAERGDDGEITRMVADAKLLLGPESEQESRSDRTARRLVAEAERAQAGRDMTRARRLVDQSLRILESAVPAADEKPAAQPVAAVDAGQRRAAHVKVVDARIARDRAYRAVPGDARVEAADRYLEQSRRAWDAGDFIGSERYAVAAERTYLGALEGHDRRVPASRRGDKPEVAAQPGPSSVPMDAALTPVPVSTTAPTAAAPVAAAPAGSPEGSAQRAAPMFLQVPGRPAASPPQPPGPPESEWGPAYSRVIEALIARDRAEAVAGKVHESALGLGRKFLARAQDAWKMKTFRGAERLARAAEDEFAAVLAAVERAAASSTPAEDPDPSVAPERPAEVVVAPKPSKRVEPDEAPPPAAVAPAAAEVVPVPVPEPAPPSTKEAEPASRASVVDDDIESADIDEPPEFTIPGHVTRIRRSQERLLLDPRVEFASGKMDIAEGSRASIDELAVVLESNLDLIARVRVVGHTDARGPRRVNLRISETRAQAVVRALVLRGVPERVLAASGMGPDVPVASNATAAGREQNRRVEIHLDLRPDRAAERAMSTKRRIER